MREITSINIERFRTPEGFPTCARDFESGQVCKFLTSQKFGFVDVCFFTGAELVRVNDAYLAPCNDCVVWFKS
jgi:hypothetical protein